MLKIQPRKRKSREQLVEEQGDVLTRVKYSLSGYTVTNIPPNRVFKIRATTTSAAPKKEKVIM